MPYATTTELARYGLSEEQLEDVDPADQDGALEAASRLMDTYLAGRFSVPIASPGADLAECCAVIAGYNLISVEGFNPEGGDANIRNRYLDKIRWLEQIAAGTITPTGEGTASGSATRPVGFFVISSSQRGFSSRGTGGGGGGFVGD